MRKQHGEKKKEKEHGQIGEGDREREGQMEEVTSTDPGTASLPPAEGRTDIGTPHKTHKGQMEEYRSGATTAPRAIDEHHLSREPAEGRTDVGIDVGKEQNA